MDPIEEAYSLSLNQKDKSYIFAVDYDGTIDNAGFPRTGKLNIKAVEILKKLREKGHKVILWTCRCNKSLSDAIKACSKLGLEFDAINENVKELKKEGFSSPKIYADYYIDDRGVGYNCIDKVWDKLAKELEEVYGSN